MKNQTYESTHKNFRKYVFDILLWRISHITDHDNNLLYNNNKVDKSTNFWKGQTGNSRLSHTAKDLRWLTAFSDEREKNTERSSSKRIQPLHTFQQLETRSSNWRRNPHRLQVTRNTQLFWSEVDWKQIPEFSQRLRGMRPCVTSKTK